MKDAISQLVLIERREARNADIAAPEFLDGIPPMEEPPQGALATDEPMTELPRKQMGLGDE